MFVLFFFFQAEDGIRDGTVTGVQTCALPISRTWIAAALVVIVALALAAWVFLRAQGVETWEATRAQRWTIAIDRKSTRLNSSHSSISYAVFCLKKKKKRKKKKNNS